MKRVVLVLFCVFLSLAASLNTYSTGSAARNTGIPLEGGGSGTGGGDDDPQGHFSIPVSCEYSEYSLEVLFYFHSDIGCVTISVANLLTGEFESNIVDSQLGFSTLSISGAPGPYYISIVTLLGNTYHGQFVI